MSKELATTPGDWSPDQVKLLKDTICRGSTDSEFMLFSHACKKTGLDPFMKQIHAVKRWDSNLKREAMSIQTGIDGYRLIADRSGRFAPGREPTFVYGKDGQLISATAYVKKQTQDGTWHEVSATAFYSEYVQTTKEGNPTSFWKKMPHGQLAKCAEALALRKAFPAELSGIYTAEEMQQADNVTIQATVEEIEEVELTKDALEEFYSNFNGDKEMTVAYVQMCMAKKRWSESRTIQELQKDIQASHKAYAKWREKQKPAELPATVAAPTMESKSLFEEEAK